MAAQAEKRRDLPSLDLVKAASVAETLIGYAIGVWRLDNPK